MDLGPHAFFIAAAYGLTALVITGLILRAVIDHRIQVRALAGLESRGTRRRSDPGPGSATAGWREALDVPGGSNG